MGTGEDDPRQRATILSELIAGELRPIDALKRLSGFGWDANAPLASLGAPDVARVLRRFLSKELTQAEVEAWADALEVRDDVKFETETARAAVFELANPSVNQPLTRRRAAELEASLVCPSG